MHSSLLYSNSHRSRAVWYMLRFFFLNWTQNVLRTRRQEMILLGRSSDEAVLAIARSRASVYDALVDLPNKPQEWTEMTHLKSVFRVTMTWLTFPSPLIYKGSCGQPSCGFPTSWTDCMLLGDFHRQVIKPRHRNSVYGTLHSVPIRTMTRYWWYLLLKIILVELTLVENNQC